MPMTATATCHTEGCPSAGVAVPDVVVSAPNPDTGLDERVGGVVCGACGELIEDVVDN